MCGRNYDIGNQQRIWRWVSYRLDGCSQEIVETRGGVMVDRQRKRIAKEYFRLLNRFAKDKGKSARKEALLYIWQQYDVSAPTIYRWCKKYGVNTK